MKKIGAVHLLVLSLTFVGCDEVEFSKDQSSGSSMETPRDERSEDLVDRLDVQNVVDIHYKRETHLGPTSIPEVTQLKIDMSDGTKAGWSFLRTVRRPNIGYEDCVGVGGGGPFHESDYSLALNSMAQIRIALATTLRMPASTGISYRDKVAVTYRNGKQVIFIPSSSAVIGRGDPVATDADDLVRLFDRYDVLHPHCAYSSDADH